MDSQPILPLTKHSQFGIILKIEIRPARSMVLDGKVLSTIRGKRGRLDRGDPASEGALSGLLVHRQALP